MRPCVFFSRCCERFLDNAAETRHVVWRPRSKDMDRRLLQNRWCQEAPTCAYHCVATRRTSPWSRPRRAGTCEHRGAATGFRARQCLLTHAHTTPRFEVCRAQKTWRLTPRIGTAVSILQLSLRHPVRDETVTSGGDPCRCPRLALSSSYGAIPETVGFLVCPVGNQQIEVLLAEGNLVDGLYTVATASRPTVGSPRSILEAAFNAPAASGIQCVLDFSASHDSQCSIVFHTASGSCFPSHTAGHGCLVARISHLVRPIDTVSGVETDVSHNARSCKDGMFIAFCAHFVLNFSPCTAGSCLFTDPCFSPILGVFQPLSNRVSVLRNRIKRACVLVERTNGKVNLNRVFRMRWLCEGCACRVQNFMLSLSVFL